MKTRTFLPAAVIAITLVLVACSSSNTTNSPTAKPPEPTLTPASPGSVTVDIAISGFAFDPASVTVTAGTTVRWTNNDSVTHTVVGDSGDWSSIDLAQGEKYSRVFDTPGTYAYHCGIHPSMQGTIIVTS